MSGNDGVCEVVVLCVDDMVDSSVMFRSVFY